MTDDRMQQQPLQAFRTITCNRKVALSEFASRCHILGDLIRLNGVEVPEHIMESMFQQSAAILGEQ